MRLQRVCTTFIMFNSGILPWTRFSWRHDAIKYSVLRVTLWGDIYKSVVYSHLLWNEKKSGKQKNVLDSAECIEYCVFRNNGHNYRHLKRGNTFYWFSPLRVISETNHLKTLDIELLDLGNILGVATSWGWPGPFNWKSITITKTCLRPLMMEILIFSKLLPLF